jgi:hypothetical protein
VGGFLKIASALGCGILHPDPKDIYFEWINSDRGPKVPKLPRIAHFNSIRPPQK